MGGGGSVDAIAGVHQSEHAGPPPRLTPSLLDWPPIPSHCPAVAGVLNM